MGHDLTFIHKFIRKDARAPTLLLLHGTGGDENDLISLGEFLLPEASLLSPRGRVLENGAPRFFRRFSEGLFDLEDLELQTRELDIFINNSAVNYGFDKTAVVAVGFSNGANIAASLLLSYPETLRSAVLFSPMLPFRPRSLPNLKSKNIFIGAGRADRVITPDKTEELQKVLTSAGAEVSMYWHADGHNLDRREVESAQLWLTS